MALTLEKKKAIVEEVSGVLPQAKAVYLVNFLGLNVGEITELRARIREAGGYFKVVKNTLLRRVFAGTPYESLFSYLEGPNALLLALEDEVTPLKAVMEFFKEVEKGEVRVGQIGEEVMEGPALEALSKLPGVQELRAQVVGAVGGPLYGLVWNLKGLLSQLVWVLNAVSEKKNQ